LAYEVERYQRARKSRDAMIAPGQTLNVEHVDKVSQVSEALKGGT
jgi:hypothetical protein